MSCHVLLVALKFSLNPIVVMLSWQLLNHRAITAHKHMSLFTHQWRKSRLTT